MGRLNSINMSIILKLIWTVHTWQGLWFSLVRNELSNKWSWYNSICKTVCWTLIAYTKINSRYINDLNIKSKVMKILQENQYDCTNPL